MATIQPTLLTPEDERRFVKPPEALVPTVPDPLVLLQAAIDKGVGVTELAAIYETHEKRLALQEFQGAMLRFKSAMPVIVKSKHVKIVPKDTSKQPIEYDHAELDKVCDLLTPALLAVQISARWEQGERANGLIPVRCILTHVRGHSEDSGWFYAGPDDSGGKNNIQAVGSTISYLRRYSLLGVCGLAPKGEMKDDDARGAGDPTPRLDDINERLDWIRDARHGEELDKFYQQSWDAAEKIKDKESQVALGLARIARCEDGGELFGVFAKLKPLIKSLNQPTQAAVITAKDKRKSELAARK